jgi:hypothetical protein
MIAVAAKIACWGTHRRLLDVTNNALNKQVHALIHKISGIYYKVIYNENVSGLYS